MEKVELSWMEKWQVCSDYSYELDKLSALSEEQTSWQSMWSGFRTSRIGSIDTAYASIPETK